MANEAAEVLLERALDRARALGAAQAEAFYVASSSDSVSFDSNRLEGINSGRSGGIGVRVIVDGRIGFSSTSILDDVDACAGAAVQMAALAPREKAPFALPGGGGQHDLTDSEVDAISVGELVEAGRAAVDRLQGIADGVLAGAGAGRSRLEVAMANSNGLHAGYRKSGWGFSAAAKRIVGTSVVNCYDGAGSNHRDIDIDAVIEATADKLRRSLAEGRLEAARRPVILTPAALNALLGAVRSGVNGAAVHHGTSPLKGRLGDRILNPLVTLVDDLRPEAGRSGSPFDDEGILASPLPIVESGVLKNYVCDLRFGARIGAVAGRAARASYTSMPYPGGSNAVMTGGQTPLSEMMAMAAGGIVIDSVMGLHGSNLANGDFSVNIGLGFAIGPGGETLFRVKDAAIAGNVYDLLGDSLVALSSERRRSYGGSDLLPWALCADVAIA